MKKISILATFVFLICTSSHVMFASHNSATPLFNSFDDDDDDFAITSDLNELDLNSSMNESTLHRSSPTNAEGIVIFFSIIQNPAAILNLPIYQYTHLIANRPVLDLPFALTYGFDNDSNSLSFVPFLNCTTKKHFTATATTLNNYFLLGNPVRIAELIAVDEFLQRDTMANLAKSLVLFDPAVIQENRIGAIFEAKVKHNKWSIIAQLPFLYAERNLYLTPVQKAGITYSSLGKMLATDNVDQHDFIYDHIVMDQFGISDLKFKTMYQMHHTNKFNLDLGGFVILPTATPFAQGIIGTWFDQNNDRGYLDLTTIDPSNVTQENQDQIANFFLSAVDKLSSIILNAPLGNNGHVVLAPSTNFDWYFAQNWQWSNDFSLQFSLPATEARFYQYIQSQEQFMASYNAAYPSAPQYDPLPFAQFVNQELQNLFFPYMFPTMVTPGLVFNSTNQLVYHLATTDLYLGSNFWYQGAEKLHIKNNPNANNQPFSYDYAGAQLPSAAQEKLFAKVNYNIETTNYSWSLSGYGDITVWNSGIGNDFTFALSIDCKF